MVRFNIHCPLVFPAEQFWRIRDTSSFLDFVVTDGMLKNIQVTTPEKQDDGSWFRVQHYCPKNVQCPDFIRAIVGDTMFEVSDEQRWTEDERPYRINFFIRPSFLSNLSRTSGELILQPLEQPQSDQTHRIITDTACTQNQNIDKEMTNCDNGANHQIDSDSLQQDSPANTNPEPSDGSDSSDTETEINQIDRYIERIPVNEKCNHIVKGITRVSILTVGWFVERAIVHNLKLFYESYPKTVARFRQRLYKQFADGDTTIPIHVVVDRYLEQEAKRTQEEEALNNNDEHNQANIKTDMNQDEVPSTTILTNPEKDKKLGNEVESTANSLEDVNLNISPTSVGMQGQQLTVDT